MSTPQRPYFFIVGAAKAGTTSLADYLSHHPQVYMCPVKEPNYFATDIRLDELAPAAKKRLQAQDLNAVFQSRGKVKLHRAFIRDEKEYLQLFAWAPEGSNCGEASPSYLYSTTAAQEIHRFNPNAKIIMVLREPVSRAFSHYLMDVRLTFEKGTFEQALRNDGQQQTRSWGSRALYKELGLYSEQVKRYLEAFPRGQILILLYEDLARDTPAVLRQICRFLEIDPEVNIRLDHSNTAIVPRNVLLRKLAGMHTLQVKMSAWLGKGKLKSTLKKLFYKKPEVRQPDPQTAEELKNYFRGDISELEKITGLQLHHWK